jgi:hypothetical protein
MQRSAGAQTSFQTMEAYPGFYSSDPDPVFYSLALLRFNQAFFCFGRRDSHKFYTKDSNWWCRVERSIWFSQTRADSQRSNRPPIIIQINLPKFQSCSTPQNLNTAIFPHCAQSSSPSVRKFPHSVIWFYSRNPLSSTEPTFCTQDQRQFHALRTVFRKLRWRLICVPISFPVSVFCHRKSSHKPVWPRLADLLN